jgi:membrane protease YdiL (CAAX protease family)
MHALWQRLLLIARAVIAGLIVLVAGAGPWSILAGWNLRVFSTVPWSIVPMAVYLWLFWKYVGGAGWPDATADARRTSLRANPVAADVWPMAIVAGLIGLAALMPLLGIMSRLAPLPAESQPIEVPPGISSTTVFLMLVMASIVAGVVEEAAFRGYMQTPIERRHGVVVAILVNGTLFGLGHFSHHPAAVLAMLPFYIGVAAVYGGLAWATDSILPGLVLHATGDVFSLTRLWITGRPEWQLTTTAPPPLIWETGVDAAFVRSLLVFVALAAATSWAYWALGRATRPTPLQAVR